MKKKKNRKETIGVEGMNDERQALNYEIQETVYVGEIQPFLRKFILEPSLFIIPFIYYCGCCF